jgi:hypothetical protein
MGGELTMDRSDLRAFVRLVMFLTFGLACLDTGYAVRDIYKYRISGERVCAHIDEVAAKPIVGMGGKEGCSTGTLPRRIDIRILENRMWAQLCGPLHMSTSNRAIRLLWRQRMIACAR